MARHSKEAAAILASAPPLPLDPVQWREVARALDLSDREADVAELVLRDLCNKQIAAVLGISKKTVDEYLSYRIPKKTGTNGRMQLSMRVLEVVLRGAGHWLSGPCPTAVYRRLPPGCRATVATNRLNGLSRSTTPSLVEVAMFRPLVRAFVFSAGVSVSSLWTEPAKASLLDFETTPAGVAPADDELLAAPYPIEGGGVRFFFDANGNNAFDAGIDLHPAFEHIRGDGVNGFRSTYFNGAFDRALPGYEAQLGSFFLRHPGAFATVDRGNESFIADYDVTMPIVELSGEIWDIDSSAGGTEQWRVDVLDSLGVVLATQTSPLGINQNDPSSLDSLPWTFQFTELPAGVDKLRITFLGTKTTGLGFAFNNFSPTEAVPEPGALALACIGGGLLTFAVRRQGRRTSPGNR